MAKADGVTGARQAERGGCYGTTTPLFFPQGDARHARPAVAGSSREVTVGSHTLAVLQVGTGPGWVGPTIAVSLAVMALCCFGVTAAVGIAALRVSKQVKKLGATVDGLQDDVGQALVSVRRLTEQGQDLMVLVRHEAGALAQVSRRVRRKLVRGVDRVEGKLADLETLYDLVHGEVEDAALDVAATLRSVRRGNGMIGRVRRMLVAGRS